LALGIGGLLSLGDSLRLCAAFYNVLMAQRNRLERLRLSGARFWLIANKSGKFKGVRLGHLLCGSLQPAQYRRERRFVAERRTGVRRQLAECIRHAAPLDPAPHALIGQTGALDRHGLDAGIELELGGGNGGLPLLHPDVMLALDSEKRPCLRHLGQGDGAAANDDIPQSDHGDQVAHVGQG
jgi:hypothetical protein